MAALEQQHEQRVVLSDKPVALNTAGTRFAARELLEVKGMTGELCLLLSRDVDVNSDLDGQYKQLLGEAKLKAVLHASSGQNYTWTHDSWRAPHGPTKGRGALLACLDLLRNEKLPLKGTKVTSIDISSDRPLLILGASWYSSDFLDGANASEKKD